MIFSNISNSLNMGKRVTSKSWTEWKIGMEEINHIQCWNVYASNSNNLITKNGRSRISALRLHLIPITHVIWLSSGIIFPHGLLLRTHTTMFRIELAWWRRAKTPSVKDSERPKFGIISHLDKKITKCSVSTANTHNPIYLIYIPLEFCFVMTPTKTKCPGIVIYI